MLAISGICGAERRSGRKISPSQATPHAAPAITAPTRPTTRLGPTASPAVPIATVAITVTTAPTMAMSPKARLKRPTIRWISA